MGIYSPISVICNTILTFWLKADLQKHSINMISAKQSKSSRFLFKDFLKLIRLPNLLIVFLAQFMAAYFLVDAHDTFFAYFADTKLWLLIISTLLITAAGYIINDYYDVKIDFINKPDRVLVGNSFKRRVALLLHSIFNLVAVAIGFALSYTIGLINLIATFCLWLYSNQLKRLPLVGNLMVAILTGASIALVGVLYGQNEFLVNTYALFSMGITLIREIVKDMEDMKGDSTHGCKTLPIIWGYRKTKNFIYFISFLFVASLFYLATLLANTILIYYFLFLSPVFIFFIYKLYYADTTKGYLFLSNYCKMIMLSGILSMIFF